MPGNNVLVKILGDASSLQRAVAKADTALGTLSKHGGKAGLVGALGGLAGAVTGAALPAVLGLAAGAGVAAAALSGTSEALDAHSKAMAGDAGAMEEYNKLLAKMSPAQREFTEQLVSMKPALSQLQDTAAESFLPGVTDFLRDSEKLLPVVDRGVARLGKTMGKTMSEFGDTVATDRFRANLEGAFETADVVTAGIGDSLARLTDRSIQFAAEMKPAAEGFASFLDGVTSGVEGMLDELAPHAEDFKSIWQSLGSLSEDLLPMVGQLAGALAEDLAPVLRDVAGWVRENKDAIGEWVPVIGDAVLALAGLKVLNTIVGWGKGAAGVVSTLVGHLGGLGTKIDDVDKKAGKAGGPKGGIGLLDLALRSLKVVGVAAAIYGVAKAIDELNGEAEKTGGSAENLHQFVETTEKIFSGDIGAGQMVDQVKAAVMGMGNALSGFHPSPIVLQADGTPARAEVDRLVGEINSAAPTMDIDGNTVPAGAAVRAILGEIAAGHEYVTIDGNPVPVQDALQRAVSLIDTSVGNVTVDGKTEPAGMAVAELIRSITDKRPYVAVGAETGAANRAIDHAARPRTSTISVWYEIKNPGTIAGARAHVTAGRATGGPITGPGSGTSDTAGLFALSNGEHVLTAREVRNAGGHGAIERFRAALASGQIRGLAAGGPTDVASTWRRGGRGVESPPRRAEAADVQVRFVGNTSDALATVIMQLIRTGQIQIQGA